MENGKSEFTSFDEISALTRAFEACSIAPSEFSHRRHLAVALHYLMASDIETAADSMRTGLKNLLARNGLDGYHETITLFWLRRLEQCLARTGVGVRSIDEANRILDAHSDSKVIFDYYSREHLMSDIARREWVDPDLKSMED